MKLEKYILIFLGYSLGYSFAEKFDYINCGRSNSGVKRLIINGSPAAAGSYPWMVTVRGLEITGGGGFCGGSLLSENWILTAAHCVSDANIYDIEIHAGIHYYDNRDGGQALEASEVIIHPQYSKGNNYDIALMKTNSSVKFGENVGSICLPSKDYYPLGEATFVGWGEANYEYHSEPATELMEATLKVLPKEDCISDSTVAFCASMEEGSPCFGDSGGPLFQYDRHGRAIVIGIASLTTEYCRPGSQSIFTRVSAFLDWIDENTD